MSLRWKLSKALLTQTSDAPVAPSEETPSLRELLRQTPPSVVAIIDDQLERQVKKINFFRPSMLHGCNRANVMHYRQSPFHPSRQDPRMLRILDNGSAVHTVLQKYLADHPEWFFAPEARVFMEVEGALIRGSCDGVLIRRDDGYRVGIEIKSIAHAAFMKLTKPKPWHVDQARIYMRLTGLYWIVIVYWDKDKQHLKEFPVRYDAAAWKKTRRRIKELKAMVDSGKLPDFDPETCNPTFCQYVDYCKKRGGKPELASRRW